MSDIEKYYPPENPPDFTKLDYDDLVDLGRKVASRYRWLLGDLASEVDTHYDGHDLAQFAEDIGVSYSTLRDYKAVSLAYPPESVARATHSWSVCRVLAARWNRLELLASKPAMTVAQAKELASPPGTPKEPKPTLKEQIEQRVEEAVRPYQDKLALRDAEIALRRQEYAQLQAERKLPDMLAELDPDPSPPPGAPPAEAPPAQEVPTRWEEWVSDMLGSLLIQMDAKQVPMDAGHELARRILQQPKAEVIAA